MGESLLSINREQHSLFHVWFSSGEIMRGIGREEGEEWGAIIVFLVSSGSPPAWPCNLQKRAVPCLQHTLSLPEGHAFLFLWTNIY